MIARLLILRNERGPDPCEATEFSSNKSGFDENWLEKSDYDTGFCSQNGIDACNGVQAVHLCSDTSSDNDFCLVVSRKRARKEKKMSLWRSYGECALTITNVRNEKCVGRAPMPIAKEVTTNYWSYRQNHVDRVHPQHGIALKHSTKNFMQRPRRVCMETQKGVQAEDSKVGASLDHLTGVRDKKLVENHLAILTKNSSFI